MDPSTYLTFEQSKTDPVPRQREIAQIAYHQDHEGHHELGQR